MYPRSPPCIDSSMVSVEGVKESVVGMLRSVQAALWTEAVPEQQRLTVQLVRNTVYFTASCLLISQYGDLVTV